MIQILLVHPDRKLVSIQEANLKRHFQVDSAHNGLMGVRKSSLLRPSIIISDYRLPLLSGLSLLKYIRGHKTLQAIPFLFLTDHPDPTEALSLGANEWLQRADTTPELLVEKIYHHLKHNPHALQIN